MRMCRNMPAHWNEFYGTICLSEVMTFILEARKKERNMYGSWEKAFTLYTVFLVLLLYVLRCHN